MGAAGGGFVLRRLVCVCKLCELRCLLYRTSGRAKSSQKRVFQGQQSAKNLLYATTDPNLVSFGAPDLVQMAARRKSCPFPSTNCERCMFLLEDVPKLRRLSAARACQAGHALGRPLMDSLHENPTSGGRARGRRAGARENR